MITLPMIVPDNLVSLNAGHTDIGISIPSTIMYCVNYDNYHYMNMNFEHRPDVNKITQDTWDNTNVISTLCI